MTASRYETRRKLEKLLALAARPGTPGEGDAALAAAQRLADRYGFSIGRRRSVTPARERRHGSGLCEHCGAYFPRAHTGRPRHFCSTRCRVAAHRQSRR